MALNPPKALFPVPSGSLQISELPPAVVGSSDLIRFSLVIPTYNECANIKSIVRILSQLLDTSIPGSYELIVVDDDSPYPTWEVALSLRCKRFLKFNIICLAGLFLNVLVLNLLFNRFGVDRYLANLMEIAVVTVWNFWVNLNLSWRVTQVK